MSETSSRENNARVEAVTRMSTESRVPEDLWRRLALTPARPGVPKVSRAVWSHRPGLSLMFRKDNTELGRVV